MARRQKAGSGPVSGHRSLNYPGLFMIRMLIFLTLVGFVAAILHEQLIRSIMANPGLNGLILLVLAFGIIYAFQQVLRLYREIRWVNGFRIADPGHAAATGQPRLLAPMATMLRETTGNLSLSTTAMSSIMDSIGSRLDEARDTGRYLVGLLVFLGLLGTFWGLLETIQAVGGVIGTIDTNANDTVTLFGDLKAGLAAPLQGMGTAFSSSLLGLAGSLVLGFLELQASHAHNRFYNELEEWLSGITELTPGTSATSEGVNRQLSATLYDLQRILEEMNVRLGEAPGTGSLGSEPQPAGTGVSDLTVGVNQLVEQMRAEQRVVREWVDDQAAQQQQVTDTLRDLAVKLERQRG